MSESDLNPVSVTQGDRVLTGVGADAEQLAAVMERHAPEGAETTVEKPTETQAPKETRGAKRYAELTSQRDKEKNAREVAERERDELRAKLATQPAVAREPERAVEPPKAPATRSKPAESEVGTKYETYADFIEDLADWKAEQRLSAQDFDAQIRRSIEADRASRTQVERETQEIARGRQAYADFDAVMRNAAHLRTNDWPIAIVEFVAQAENAHDLRYALAKDPALAEKIRTMNPLLAGQELAKLMPAPAVARLASTAGAGTVTPPPPFQPVGAGSKTTAPPLADLPKKAGFDYDNSGYRERRAEQLGRTRRR